MNGELGLRDRKKRQTRAALCRAAVTLVLERGLDHVTVEDISTAAGVSPRTFFNYFPGKEDAVVGPDPEVGPRVRRRVLEQPADVVAGDAVRVALLAEISDVMAEERELWLLRMKVVKQHPALLARVFAGGEEAEKHLVAGIAERVGQQPTDLYPMLLASAAGAACRVAFARWAEQGDPPPLENLLDEALDLLFTGLSEPSSTP